MNGLKKLLGLCTLILLVMSLTVTAQPQVSYESAAVGRIVGETPEEMKQQLMHDELELEYATYFAANRMNSLSENERAENVVSVLENEFPENTDTQLVTGSLLGRWGWDDVKESIDDWSKKTLLVLEANGKVKNGEIIEDSPDFFDESLTTKNLNWDLERSQLILFNSDFAGIHLPKKETFVKELNKYAAIIAPTAISDKEFVKVFVCNLGKYESLGETYRNARNNYYWQTNKPSGIALMSYELYGNPLAEIRIPNYDEAAIEEFCEDFNKDFGVNELSSMRELTILSEEPNGFKEVSATKVVAFDNYEVIDLEMFSFLTVPGAIFTEEEDELILPKATIVEEFPLRTVITNVEVISLSNPVELTIPNLPEWSLGPVERECVFESKDADLSYAPSFTSDRQTISVTINPVEVTNCAEGKVKLYQEVSYGINYISYSPVLIKEVIVPYELVPEQEVTANVILQSTQTGSFEGELMLRRNGEVVTEESVIFANGQREVKIELKFLSSEQEGTDVYKIEFMQNGELKTFYDFSVKVNVLTLSLQAPVTAKENGELILTVNNMLVSPLDSVINSYLIRDNEIESNSEEITLSSGDNKINLPYSSLNREDRSYEFIVTTHYGNVKEAVTTTLVTNHPPILETLEDITIIERDTVIINPVVMDIDNDDIEVSYFGDMGSNEWQTAIGDAGEYEVDVVVSDGILEDEQTIKITILASNDLDGDGFNNEVDCNDNDESINPGAIEICDGIDNNCNDEIDDGLEPIPADVIEGACSENVNICTGTDGYQNSPDNYVPFEEVCNEIDDDCNGIINDGLIDKNEDGMCDVAPILNPIGDKIVRQTELLTFIVNSTDVDTDEPEITSSELPEGATFSDEGLFSWTPGFNQKGDYKIMFRVYDGSFVDHEVITITVLKFNRPPEVNVSIEPEGNIVNEREKKLFIVNVTDPDHDFLTFEWKINGEVVSNSINYGFAPSFTDGDDVVNNEWEIVLTASDGEFEVVFAETFMIENSIECFPFQTETASCGEGLGICSLGEKTRACGTDYKWGKFSECTGIVEPEEEICGNWLDDDCDGEVNNECGTSELVASWQPFVIKDRNSEGVYNEISVFSIMNASPSMKIGMPIKIENKGKEDAPPSLSIMYLNEKYLLRHNLPRIDAGESITFIYPISFPREGSNFVEYVLDINDKVAETKENNNVIDWNLGVFYNDTYVKFMDEFSENYHSRFPTKEECEMQQGKCW